MTLDVMMVIVMVMIKMMLAIVVLAMIMNDDDIDDDDIDHLYIQMKARVRNVERPVERGNCSFWEIVMIIVALENKGDDAVDSTDGYIMVEALLVNSVWGCHVIFPRGQWSCIMYYIR